MGNDDFSRHATSADRVRADVEVATVTTENAPSLKYSNTSPKVAVVSNEFYRPKRFYHRFLLWLFMRVSGKTQERMRLEFSWHYFVTRSTWRAYFRTVFYES